MAEFWKRQQAELAFDWHVSAEELEVRPQFRGTPAVDGVTGKT